MSFSLAIDLLSAAKNKGIDVLLDDDKLQLKIPKELKVDAHFLETIKNNKESIIEFLKNDQWKAKRIDPAQKEGISRLRDKNDKIPLSFSQERLWFIDRMEGSVQYHIPAVLRLKGNLNEEALAFAIQNIVNRHEILRTVIREHDGIPWQEVQDKNLWRMDIIDVREDAVDDSALGSYAERLINEPFDLSSDHKLRAKLIRIGQQDYLLVITMHHIASDGWSTPILINELTESYAAFADGRSDDLLPLMMQYADYAIWQRRYYNEEFFNQKLSYWKNHLADVAATTLHTDYDRLTAHNIAGARVSKNIGNELTEALLNVSGKERTSLYMTLLSAFKIMLYRYTGDEDICIGSSIAGREGEEIARLVGFFANTLALRTQLSDGMRITEVLQRVKQTVVNGLENQEVPFDKVVEVLALKRETRRNPLFEIMFVLENNKGGSRFYLGDLDISMVESMAVTSKFDLTLHVSQSDQGLFLYITYRKDLFRKETMEQLLVHYENILKAIIVNPDVCIDEINMLDRAEERRLTESMNFSTVACPRDKTVVDQFEEQAAATPYKTAVVFEEQQLSYMELNKLSNQLAHYLRKQGVKPEMPVPVCLKRSPEMIIAIWGILKAGGAYVPIESNCPPARFSYILNDLGSPVIVTAFEQAAQIKQLLYENDIQTTAVVDITDMPVIAAQPTDDLSIKITPHNLAYIIYTSGSTGMPKGVMIEHRNLTDYVFGFLKSSKMANACSFALVSTLSADLGNTVIYASLLSGGVLHVLSETIINDADKACDYFSRYSIDCLKITPSHWNALCTQHDTLLPRRLLIFGGEALSGGDVQKAFLRGSECTIINHYGPTETTIGKLLHHVREAAVYGPTVPIGAPFGTTHVYILDKKMNICPVGVPGVLYIGGAGLARGYLNQPALTNERFIADPFQKEGPGRLYNTGDICRWLADGQIEYIARADNQVKIRGYRVELGEIENVLKGSPLISGAVVIAAQHEENNKTLIAYVVPVKHLDQDALRNYLCRRLPDYMVPSLIIELPALPLTSNGKIDKKALLSPDAALQKGLYIAPRNDIQHRLAAIWQQLLDVEQVSITDDFFQLGGHSLLAIRMVAGIRKELSVEVTIGDVFDYPTIESLSEQLNRLSNATLLPALIKQERPPHIPLSFSQERLWFLDQLEGSIQYHIPTVIRLNGALNLEALQYVLQTIVNRHEVLRTVICQEDGVPWQHVLPKDQWKLTVVQDLVNSLDAASLKSHILKLIELPFDLSVDYNLRAHLIALSSHEHILIVTLHHIATDGWSKNILVKEFVELYDAFLQKRTCFLQELPIQYIDFALWQRNYLSGEILANKLDYWRQQLSGVTPLGLLTDFPRPAISSKRGARVSQVIDKDLHIQLQQLAKQENCTLYMLLLSVLNALLYRYSGQSDISIGSPVAGRQHQEVEGLVGCFINTLVLRNEVKGQQSFVNLLQNVKSTTLTGYAHQDVPFELIVEAVMKERDRSRSSLFEVLFVYENDINGRRRPTDYVLNGLQVVSELAAQQTAKFDLSMAIAEAADGLHIEREYCIDLFEEATIHRMMRHYENLLRSVVRDPHLPIEKLPMLTLAEQKQIVEEFNDTQIAYQLDRTVLQLFEEQVERTPDNIAVVFEEQYLTYKQLDERSNQLAQYLHQIGVRRHTPVILCLNRSIEMMLGVLGIWKAGGIYVPVDPEYPINRITYILEDVNASIILSTGVIKDQIGEHVMEDVIALDHQWEEIEKLPVHPQKRELTMEDPAYIIYTSGSTGKPKGVMIKHKGVTNRLLWSLNHYTPGSQDSILQKTNFCFDVSVWELFWPLLGGARLVFARSGGHKDGEYLKWIIENENITAIHFVPSMLEMFLQDFDKGACKTIKRVFCSGEALKPACVKLFREVLPEAELFNLYGPTEVSIDVSYWAMPRTQNDVDVIPIGKPLSNTQIYILDTQKCVVPVGVAGEIYIGGVGVAIGYLNQPELTREKFVDDWFSQQPGAYLYRTGDLARWLPDGNIEFLGRKDDQVKIRGFRVELAEIEHVLQQSPFVHQAVAVTYDDATAGKRLVAYVVPTEFYDNERVFEFLRSRLPEYMVPSILITLEKLPLTSSGKIDKKALPDPRMHQLVKEEYMAPRNRLEQQLAEIWQRLLSIDRIGVYDNFFELGGHSLLAIRMVAVIRKQLAVEINVRDVFDYPTIESLSGQLSRLSNATLLPAMYKQERPARIPLSFSQERLWFLDQLEGSIQYHIPAVLHLKGPLNLDALQYALQTIVNRHEVLRTVIYQEEGAPWQRVLQKDQWKLTVVNDQVNLWYTAGLESYITKLIELPFDLSVDYNLRAHLIEGTGQEHILVLTLHHIATDGWSRNILIKEFLELYDAFVQERTCVLKELPLQYIDFALWQRSYFDGQVLANNLDYWKQQLSGVRPLELLTDFPRPVIYSNRGATVSHVIGKKLHTQLQQLAQQQNCTLYMLLLSALNVLLYRYTAQADISIGSPVAGRQHQEVEGLVGCFINTLVLRNEVKGQLSFIKLLQNVKGTTLAAFAHQDVPFELIVEAVMKERDRSRSPLFQVLFLYENNINDRQAAGHTLNGLQVWPEPSSQHTAKFDLSLAIAEAADGLHIEKEYCTDLFEEATIRRMMAHYENLLRAIVQDPHLPVGKLQMLTAVEEEQVLTAFNNTQVAYPYKTVPQLFEEQVQRSPNNIAVVFEEQCLTYKQLDERSNQLAHYLRQRGVREQSPVHLCLDRSIEMMVGLLGIWKAGGIYVPVDPEYPIDRITYILQDVNASIVVSTRFVKDRIGMHVSADMIELDSQWQEIEQLPVLAPQRKLTAEDPAYVIYTSGSTGKPKGVMIAHKGVANRLLWALNHYTPGSDDSILQKTSFCFDVSVWELMWPLLGGARLVFARPGGHKDGEYLKEIIQNEKITAIHFVPSMLEMFLQDIDTGICKTIKRVFCSGEALKPACVRLFREVLPHATLYNLYGPTEASIDVTFWPVPETLHDEDIIPIGKPIANTQIYILDAQKCVVPVGVAGEIYIGGVGVAAGYLNQPELTREKFVADWLGQQPDACLYRTGDVARWLPNGNIEFLGRKDEQVKIRGFRVELAEIEQVLQQSPFVHQAVVVAYQDAAAGKRLVAYVVPAAQLDSEAIFDHLRGKLPEYMIPSSLISLEKLPFTSSGKVDKKALPDPRMHQLVKEEYMAPRNRLEQQLAEIWQRLLSIDRIGVYDNFFELGGHSLLAIRMVSVIKKQLNTAVTVKAIFEFPQVALLARFIQVMDGNDLNELSDDNYEELAL